MEYVTPEGFTFSETEGVIHKSENSHVLLGSYQNEKAVLKIFPSKFPSDETIRSYQKDDQINTLLYGKYPKDFSKPIKFKNEGNVLFSIKSALGTSLQNYQQKIKRFSIEHFLKVAIQICQVLHYIHEQNILHCDIKPQNILYDEEKDKCTIIDFESSFLVSFKNPSVSKSERGKKKKKLKNFSTTGTFSYMSPEQTGRTSQGIDKRSDIYCLGISFFEMLTGKLPFTGEVNQVIYSHIAEKPPLMSSIRKDIPKSVEEVIQKMLKKNQSERYHSIMGVKKELEFILNHLKNEDELKEFKAGKFDIDDIFSFENKIYGREKEIEIFNDKIEKIKIGKTTEMIMISGVSGIGKSSLVQEILSDRDENLILKGKFDQFLQSPFSAFKQVLKRYFEMLSSEAPNELKKQKEIILKALDKRGKVLTNFLNGCEFILGEQEELQILPNEKEEQKRFIKTMIDFFSVIGGNRLLCLFLDDLQWADIPSLELIEELIKQENCKILIIGAYRDNEVSPTHPMVTILEPIIKERNFETINLSILDERFVQEMLEDSLDSKQVKQLSEIIHKKTNGNPFFMKEFIFNLYDKKLIKFDYKTENWTWDLEQIAASKFSENVVEFMIEKIHEFPESTKKVLNLASCIGCEFTLELLSTLHQKSQEEIYQILLEVITHGWVFEIGNSFKFVHDRLQQASYEIYEDKKKIHFEIGELFLKNALENNEMDRYIFDIVNHLNSAGDYYKDIPNLIQLNLRAGKVALKSHAFDPALSYARIAKSLLSEDSWKYNHKLTFEVIQTLANYLSLNRKLDEAAGYFEELLTNAETNLEKLKIATPYIKNLIIVFDFEKSKQVILQMMTLYEVSRGLVSIEPKDARDFTMKLNDEVCGLLEGMKSSNDMGESNEEMTALCEFLFNAGSPYYQTSDFEITIAIWLFGVKVSILHGRNDFTPPLFSSCSWLSHALFENSKARKLGIFAQELLGSIKDPNLTLFSTFFMSMNSIFIGTIKQAIELSEKGYSFALSIGEYLYGSYCNISGSEIKFANGCNFRRLLSQMESSKNVIYNTNNYFMGDTIELTRVKCAIISGSELKFEPKFAIPGFETYPFARAMYGYVKVFVLYLLRDFDEAKKAFEELKAYRIENIGASQYYEMFLHGMLVYSSLSSPKKYINEMKEILDFLKKHHDINPNYFAPRYYLANAIYESVANENYMTGFIAFQKAIEECRGVAFISALANEYFAEFCKKKPEFGEYGRFLEGEAYTIYKNMDAFCKYKHLTFRKNSYSDSSSDSPTNTTAITTTTTNSTGAASLDLQTILKASTTISEGLDKEKLLMKLNQVLVENAGAEKGFIILKENEKYLVKSEFSTGSSSHLNDEIKENCDFLCMKIFNQCVNQRDTIIIKNAKYQLSSDSYIQENKVKSVLCAPILKGKTISGILYLENNKMEGAFTQNRKFLFQHVLSQVAIAIENISLFEDVKTINSAYARFLPSEFLNQLSKKDVRNIQPSESVEKKMTIMFSDIRNFTAITDKMNAKESFEFVNEILSKLAPSISRNHGFVDKFIGDCVMAIFPESPLDGVKSSLQMLSALEELNKTKEIPINIGIGLAYGNVMLGTLGFEERLDATVISKTVNTASRMELLTKMLGVNIIITEEIHQVISSDLQLNCNYLGTFYLKGQENSKKLYEVTEISSDRMEENQSFQKSLILFSQKKFKESFEILSNLKNRKIYSYYMNVCELYQIIELPDDWRGEIKISKDGEAQPFQLNDSRTMKEQLALIQKLIGSQEKFKYLYEAAKKIENSVIQEEE